MNVNLNCRLNVACLQLTWETVKTLMCANRNKTCIDEC